MLQLSRFAAVVFLLFGLSTIARAPDGEKVTVHANLVSVNVSVTDSRGKAPLTTASPGRPGSGGPPVPVSTAMMTSHTAAALSKYIKPPVSITTPGRRGAS